MDIIKSHRRVKLATAMTLAITSFTANAEMFELGMGDSNFTMLDPNGNGVGGTNTVVAMWDGTLNTDVATAVTNMTLSSTAPFFSAQWFAHDVQLFGPGTYTFEACPGPFDDTGFSADGSSYCGGISRPQTMVVGDGQVGVHMLFDWNSSVNIDVVNVWDVNAAWAFGPNDGSDINLLQTADSGCVLVTSKKADATPELCAEFYATEWLFTATDPDGDGIAGTPMIDGPFQGFNAAFNVQPAVVPVPAAVWLMGSGLLGLVGVARRKTTKI